MKLVDALTLLEWSMTRHGLTGWRGSLDNAKRRCGQCSYGDRSITLSRHYVALNEVADVKDTILHEIAHALVGPGHHHDRVWQAKCAEIGARPVRCKAFGAVKMPEGAWKATCACGVTVSWHKRPRGRGYYHVKCGKERGKLTPVCSKVNFNKNPG